MTLSFNTVLTTQLESLSTAELVTFFNELSGSSVKRFADRAVALRRVDAARDAWMLANRDTAMAAEAAERAASEVAVAAAIAQAHADHAESTFTAPNFRHTCPGCGAHQDITPAGLEGTTAETRNFCHSCGCEWFPETGKLYHAPKASPTRSAGIAASWANPEVAAARAARSTVTVKGGGLKAPQEYASLRAAFAALHLPLGQHIKFRGQLKAAGTLTFIEFTFINNAK